jgi:hypothetical protein
VDATAARGWPIECAALGKPRSEREAGEQAMQACQAGNATPLSLAAWLGNLRTGWITEENTNFRTPARCEA